MASMMGMATVRRSLRTRSSSGSCGARRQNKGDCAGRGQESEEYTATATTRVRGWARGAGWGGYEAREENVRRC